MFKEILGEAFPLIQHIAPILAGALGSPLAGIGTTAAIHLLGSAFGVKPEEITKLGDVIKSHPEAETKLSLLESIFSELQSVKLPSKIAVSINIEWPNNSPTIN